MKTIIALHGNPGHPEDWQILEKTLPTNSYRLYSVEADQDTWLKILTENSSKKILVGHSWGAYRILKQLAQYKDYVEHVILITPYIKPEREISGLAQTLLKTPLLGRTLLKGNHKKNKEAFFKDLIYPLDPAVLPYLEKVKMRLDDWRVWERTALNKMKMQAFPWDAKDICNVPITVLYGKEDQISQAHLQNEILVQYPQHSIHHYDDAGHGLLWSHAGEVIKALQQQKIGYYPGTDERNNVTAYMEKHLQEFPDRVALRWASREALVLWDGNPQTPIQHEQITYKHFAARINSFARGLLDIGIQKGDRVIIFLPMSLDMYTAMFAVQKIGAIAVFLDSWARSHHLGASAECVGPKAMISFKMAFDLVDQVPEFASMPIRILYGPGDKYTHKFPDLLNRSFSDRARGK